MLQSPAAKPQPLGNVDGSGPRLSAGCLHYPGCLLQLLSLPKRGAAAHQLHGFCSVTKPPAVAKTAALPCLVPSCASKPPFSSWHMLPLLQLDEAHGRPEVVLHLPSRDVVGKVHMRMRQPCERCLQAVTMKPCTTRLAPTV